MVPQGGGDGDFSRYNARENRSTHPPASYPAPGALFAIMGETVRQGHLRRAWVWDCDARDTGRGQSAAEFTLFLSLRVSAPKKAIPVPSRFAAYMAASASLSSVVASR